MCPIRRSAASGVFLEGARAGPDAILFNGGFFIPEILRERVADVLEHWYGKRPEIFENRDLDLAVAMGAAYYSYVRSTGRGRAGARRSAADLLHRDRRSKEAVCLVPRGAEEGTLLEVDRGGFAAGGEPAGVVPAVQFADASDDGLGKWWIWRREEVHVHAPLER